MASDLCRLSSIVDKETIEVIENEKKTGITKNHGRFKRRSPSNSYVSYNPPATYISQNQPLPLLLSHPEQNIS